MKVRTGLVRANHKIAVEAGIEIDDIGAGRNRVNFACHEFGQPLGRHANLVDADMTFAHHAEDVLRDPVSSRLRRSTFAYDALKVIRHGLLRGEDTGVVDAKAEVLRVTAAAN